jgi:ribosome maturation factor RimP
MLNDSNVLSKLREVAAPVCRAHGVDLVDARYVMERGVVLRVLIERPGVSIEQGAGVGLGECQAVSRDLSTALDVHSDVIPDGGFSLEVGSPGLDRPLFSLADFARFAGHEAKIQTRSPLAGRKRFGGRLLGVEGDSVRVEQDGVAVEIPHEAIAKANLVYRF